MAGAFRAWRHPNYRLYFIGQAISLIGTWMDAIAMSWLIYRLTNSPVLLGVVGFSSRIPAFLLSPVAGVLVDRWNRRTLLIATQTLALCQASTLAILVLSHQIQIWHIILLSVLLGLVQAFDTPARQSFLVEIVDHKEDLGNAIALNSTQFNLARLIGPALAGAVIAWAGEGICFAVNAVSYLAVVGALVAMRIKETQHVPKRGSIWTDFAEGAKYAWDSYPIRSLLILLTVVSFASGSNQSLMPVYAAKIFHGDSRTYGYLACSVGFGAILGALMLANRKSVLGLGIWLVYASGIFGISLFLFGQATNFWAGVLLLAGVGFGSMVHMAATNTLIQTLVKDRIRGRVMAFYTMCFIGMMPIGSLVGGYVAGLIGTPKTLAISGVIGVIGALSFYVNLPRFRAAARPTYEEKGILVPATSST